jgi:hypothetical protein
MDLHPMGRPALKVVNNARMGRWYTWILHHDDSKAFVVVYIALAVTLTIWLGLFWLLLVVGIHGLFECIKQRHRGPGWFGTIARSAWELKLDLALIFFAFVISLYMDAIVGIAGLGAAGRVGLQGGSRFAAWQRVLRGALMSVDDAAQVGRAVLAGRRKHSKGEVVEDQTPETKSRWGGWTGFWSWGDRFSLGLAALCVLLVLVSPWLTGTGVIEVLSKLGSELHPFPS